MHRMLCTFQWITREVQRALSRSQKKWGDQAYIHLHSLQTNVPDALVKFQWYLVF